MRKVLCLTGVAAAAILGCLTATRTDLHAQPGEPRIKSSDISGVVASTRGPETGVWVIVETTGLPHTLHQGSGHRRSRPLSHPRGNRV